MLNSFGGGGSGVSVAKVQWSHSVVSDSLRPHGLQPTRLLRSWDFPGKNTGMGCHFLLQGIFLTQGSNPGLPHCSQTLYCLSYQGSPGLVAKSCLILTNPWTVACQNPFPWDSPGKNTWVGCQFLLQGIFPTQELNLEMATHRGYWIIF